MKTKAEFSKAERLKGRIVNDRMTLKLNYRMAERLKGRIIEGPKDFKVEL